MGGLSLMVCGLLVWRVTVAGARGTLKRNEMVGIRTAATKSSDDAWLTGHQAALPTARLTGWACVVIGAALTVAGAVAPVAGLPVPVVVLFVLGYGVLVVGAVLSARAASRGITTRG